MFKLFSYITVRRQKRLECFLKEYLDNYSKKDLSNETGNQQVSQIHEKPARIYRAAGHRAYPNVHRLPIPA